MSEGRAAKDIRNSVAAAMAAEPDTFFEDIDAAAAAALLGSAWHVDAALSRLTRSRTSTTTSTWYGPGWSTSPTSRDTADQPPLRLCRQPPSRAASSAPTAAESDVLTPARVWQSTDMGRFWPRGRELRVSLSRRDGSRPSGRRERR